jgi:hypothetical protein
MPKRTFTPVPSISNPPQTVSVHQDFSWLNDAAKNFPTANFVELTRDICLGIQTCLNIVNTSNLERLHNEDAKPGEQCIPAINSYECEALLRLSIASSSLLHKASERTIDWINEFGPEKIAAMKRHK